MKRIADRKFLSLFDDQGASTFADLKLEGCVFTNCVLADTKDPGERSLVRNVQIANCTAVGCAIGPALFENVIVDGLTTSDLLIISGALFRRVTLRGRIGGVKINAYPHIDETDRRVTGPFDRTRAEFYAATDWALDISGAVFSSFDATGIPARLFRRDPVTQVVLRRKNVARSGWRRKVAPWNRYWVEIIDVIFEDDPPEDAVLVAPKAVRKTKLQKMIDGLNNLRDIGVADPD